MVEIPDIDAIAAEDFAYSYLLSYVCMQFPKYQIGVHHRLIAQKLEAVERGEITRLMIFTPPRHGKPEFVGNLVLMGDGTQKPLGDIKPGDKVITHTGNPRTVRQVFEQGELDCLSITTESGREHKCAPDHPYLTPTGWKQAKELNIGEALALVKNPITICDAKESDEEFKFAGYMIGDGSCVHSPSFANSDPLIIDDFKSVCRKMNFKMREVYSAERCPSFYPSPCRDWLKKYNLYGKKSHSKEIPEFVFRGSRRQIALFLAAYFDCDGSVNRRSKARKDCCCEFYSVNHKLLRQTQHLLLRFGIRSRLSVKNGMCFGERHKSWRLTITSRNDVAIFNEKIKLVGSKSDVLQKWNPVRTDFEQQFIGDRIVDIQPAGKHKCRCLNVSVDHTFTVEDIIVHNTLLISEFFPAWYLGRNPTEEIITSTYSFNRATDIGRKVRNHLASRVHRDVFEACELSPDSKGANKLSTTAGGNYYSVGIGGAITGRGANLFIVDDPVKGREDADSEIYQRRMRDWFTSVAYTRLMKKNAVVLVMTRWHFNDLAGFLLTEKAHENWEVLNLPAIAEEDNDILGRIEGEPLWPDMYNIVRLNKIRTTIGTRDWTALYQQNPVPADGGMVDLSWFDETHYNWKTSRFFRKKHDPYDDRKYEVILNSIVMSWDTAFKESEMNDPSACTVWGISDNAYYLIGIMNRHMQYPDLRYACIRYYNEYQKYFKAPVTAVLIEDKASGQSLIQDLKRTTRMPIIAINPDANKQVRLAEVTPLMEAGKVWLPETRLMKWATTFETQLAQFPYAKHDDLVDSTSQFLRWASKKKFRKRGIKHWR